MSAFGRLLRECEGGMFMFWCPGCDGAHGVWTATPNELTGAKWGFNRDPDAPTFTPSILLSGHEMTEESKKCWQAWIDLPEPRPPIGELARRATICHSFVTNGQIQFLSDCTHALAGQTVPLPNFDQEMENS